MDRIGSEVFPSARLDRSWARSPTDRFCSDRDSALRTAQPAPLPAPSAAKAHSAPAPTIALRVAYLVPEYPKVSHSFVRREIRALEARGHSVLRLAIRRGTTVDPADREEGALTTACLDLPLLRIAWLLAWALARRPLATLCSAMMALRMGRRSDRGVLRHFAYLVEAAVLLHVCARHRVQHVHVHFGTNAAAVARLMRRLGGGRPSYSMTVHGPDEFDAPRALSLRDKVADATFVAAISDYCSAQIRRWSRTEDWHKIHVVRCTVDGAFLDAAVPVARQSRMLLSVGRLSAQKGQLLLIEAFAHLRAAGFDATLTLAGDGELRADVERAIRAHGLEHDVTLAGWVDEAELRRLLAAARAFVLPSLAEGLPVVLMEALAMERPVIATYVAGTPELVTHGQNGWLVPAANVDALACAMHTALSEPGDRLDVMGAAGARRVREHHDAATEAVRLEALLAAAVHTPPGGERG